MKKTLITAVAAALTLCSCTTNWDTAHDRIKNDSVMEEKLNLTQEWDKVFPQSDKVVHSKITFHNRYGITLAADLYKPLDVEGKKLPAIAMCGPFGAVKEQVSGRYAQTLAERGFLTIAFDPSFTGESGGRPRYVASPDILQDPARLSQTVARLQWRMECLIVPFLAEHAHIGVCGRN